MSTFKDFMVSVGLQVEDRYKSEPEGHSNAFWQHLDGSKSKYIDIDDMHLINIFLMIRRNISYYEDVIVLDKMNECAHEQLGLFKKQFAYASFEIYRRGLYVENKNEYERTN